MIVTFKTAINHGETNADGSLRDHCCGCWHFCLDEDAPDKPYARCNECSEIRVGTFPGISGSGHVSDIVADVLRRKRDDFIKSLTKNNELLAKIKD